MIFYKIMNLFPEGIDSLFFRRTAPLRETAALLRSAQDYQNFLQKTKNKDGAPEKRFFLIFPCKTAKLTWLVHNLMKIYLWMIGYQKAHFLRIAHFINEKKGL